MLRVTPQIRLGSTILQCYEFGSMNIVRFFQPMGVDLFCLNKKYLVFNLVSRNLKIKYRRSFLGVFWTLLNPIGMGVVYYFVFKVILNVQVPHYLAFILSGILPWTFFSMSVMENMESIVGHMGLITKVPVPLQIFPYIGTLTNLVTLFIAIPVLIGAAIVSEVSLGPSLLLIFYYFLILFAITYGFSLVLSVVFVFFRDLRHLFGIVMQIWFYMTPVIYSEQMIPEKYHWVIYLNPLGILFSGIHRILAQGVWPEPLYLIVPTCWAFVGLLSGLLVRKYLCTELVEQL